MDVGSVNGAASFEISSGEQEMRLSIATRLVAIEKAYTMIFYKALSEMPDPTPATEDLSGEIPSRAHRWCEPFLAANRAGWLLYPPTEFSMYWNGTDVFARFPEVEETLKVDKMFLPGFADAWCGIAPDLAELMPAFLEVFPERGIVQIWTGLFVRTEAGTHSWIRGPINRPAPAVYEVIEGIVETDWWTGPLFTNIQLVRSDEPVSFRRDIPWFQLFEVPAQLSRRRGASEAQIVSGIGAFPDAFREQMRTTSIRRNTQPPGSYRREVRALCRRHDKPKDVA